MYIYNGKKQGRCYHIGDRTGTLCKMQNSNAFEKLDTINVYKPENRRICKICDGISKSPKKLKKELKKRTKQKTKKNVTEQNFFNTYEWKKLRYKVLLKSKGKCMCCGISKDEASLHVDHIKPRKKYPELALDIDNLQVLCASCNWGKGNWDETDHREVCR